MKRKLIPLLILVCLVALVVPMTVSAAAEPPVNGWYQEGSDWYYYQEGKPVAYQVIELGSVCYGFDEYGVMYDNDDFWIDGACYRAKAGGALATGWYQDGNDWYYYLADGKAAEDFLQLGGTWYYFESDGKMATDRAVWSSKYKNYYALNKAGTDSRVLNRAGWVQAFGVWYYLRSNGEGGLSIACAEFIRSGSVCYYVDDYCQMADGEFFAYFNKESDTTDVGLATVGGAVLENGWAQLNGSRYYAKDMSLYCDNVYEIDGKLYLFDEMYALYTIPGEQYFFNKYYYVTADGSLLRNQWRKSTTGADPSLNGWRFYDEEGHLVTDTGKKIGGKTYFFNDRGVMLEGQVYYGADQTYYIDANGAATRAQGWFTDQYGQTYYATDGVLAEAVTEVDGVTYVFDAGQLVTNGYVWAGSTGCLLADAEGKLINKPGWHQIGGNWYYVLDHNGTLAEGSHTIGGVMYLFYPEMVANTIEYYGEYWYAFQGSGAGTKLTGTGWYHLCYGSIYLVNGTPVSAGWKQINGSWYYFDEYGYCRTEAFLEEHGKIYYLNRDGKMHAGGWLWLDRYETRIYADASGVLYTGMHTIGGKQYLFDSEGLLYTNGNSTGENSLVYHENQHYWLNADGTIRAALKTGWNSIGGKWYYLTKEGELLKNAIWEINGVRYGFGSDYAMCENGIHYAWYDYYIFDKDGRILTGWQKVDGKWYYADPKTDDLYVYSHGTYEIGGKTYLFHDNYLQCNTTMLLEESVYTTDANGVVIKAIPLADGFHYMADGSVYYLRNGMPCNGWVGDYFVSRGYVCYNQEIPYGDRIYYVGSDGRYVRNGWINRPDGGYSYARSDGTLYANQWLQINGTWYYFYGTKIVILDCVYIDGKYHTFDQNGKWLGEEKEPAKLPARSDGWHLVSGKWYYYVASQPVSARQYIDGVWYYFDRETYAMITNSFGGGQYYGASGAQVAYVGWQKIGGQWYYFDRTGTLVTGLQNIGGAWYCFDYYDQNRTYMVTNEVRIFNGQLYRFGAGGACAAPVSGTGWQQAGKDWYYVKNGFVLTDTTVKLGNTYYAFNFEGKMVANDVFYESDSNNYFYYNASGARVTQAGWHQASKGWVYVGTGGHLYGYGTYRIGGGIYSFYEGYWVQ